MRDGVSREAELFLHHRRGHRLPISLRTTPLEDDNGAIVGGIELFSEINPEEGLLQRMEELEQRAMIDPLTRAPNRNHLNSELSGLHHLWERGGIPFGVLFFDIDHFKRFNDTYGHDVGDRVLQTVAKSLSSSVRNYDTVGRWGGEEFVGLFPNANHKVLQPIAEKLCMVVRNSWIEENDEQLAVTISIGGTCSRKGDSIETLMKRADSLMYRSKQEGRDRSTIG
jgi:diguanylate cyclase (GGDEF)-like protein